MRRSAGAKAALLAPVLLAGCAAGGPDEQLQASAPVFDVLDFFAGRTRGEGSLKIVFKARQPIAVDGFGTVERDGTLVLTQIVRRGERPPQRRQWRIKKVGPNRYAGFLTDAAGLVQGDVRGNSLHLYYKTPDATRVHQWLYLQPDGRTALNRMTISAYGGIPVASLDETIRKVD